MHKSLRPIIQVDKVRHRMMMQFWLTNELYKQEFIIIQEWGAAPLSEEQLESLKTGLILEGMINLGRQIYSGCIHVKEYKYGPITTHPLGSNWSVTSEMN